MDGLLRRRRVVGEALRRSWGVAMPNAIPITAPRSNQAPREFASRLSTITDTARNPTGKFSGMLWRPPTPTFSHHNANQLATAHRRAVMAFSRATRGQRAVAFMLYFYSPRFAQVRPGGVKLR